MEVRKPFFVQRKLAEDCNPEHDNFIDVNPVGDDYVNLWPINSKGQISNAALLQVPMENLDELIAKLQEIKNDRQRTATC